MMDCWKGICLDKMSSIEMSDVYGKVLKEVGRDGIPPMHFKPECDVRIIPPFGGAMMRFSVDYNGVKISVYADFFMQLGFFGSTIEEPEPYWEMFPRTYARGDETYIDTMRFAISDVDGLMRNIEAELNGEVAR